jgi:hypothetical protein
MREIPENPFNDLKTVLEDTTATSGVGSNNYGWHFITSGADAGLFQADDDKANPYDPNDWHTGY